MSLMMNAAVLTAPGVPTYAEVPRPTAEQPQVKVRLAGMNPIDLFLSTQATGGFPRVPGGEGVGEIDGKRVYFSALAPHGAFAGYALARPGGVIPLAADVPDTTAIAMGTAGLTAYLSLVDRAALQPGETVLVLGATGMVGRIAVQLARELGAGRVVAAGRKAALMEDLGADAVVALTEGEEAAALAERFTLACGGRLDVIIDPLWGVPGLAALMAAGPGGRLVQLGHSAGLSVPFAPAFLRRTGAAVLGYSSSLASAARRAAVHAHLCHLAGAGRVRVPVTLLPLTDPAAIWARQAASPNAKLCITI